MYCMKLITEPEIRKAASRATELLCLLANNLSNMKYNPIETISMLRSVHNSVYQLQQSVEFDSIIFATLRNSISLNLRDYYNMPETNAYASILLKLEEANIESLRRNEARRLRSWPSINPQKMADGGKIDPDDKILRRTEYSKSMEALSFSAFVSLLVNFVARLDHLVDAVDELFKLAKFKEEHVV